MEIKNWSAYSLGGEDLFINASEADYSEFAIRQWNRIFSDDHRIIDEKVKKVSRRMKLPVSHAGWEHRALACFWFCLHPEGRPDPFFEWSVETDLDEDILGAGKPKLAIFSMSAYLRSLGAEEINVDLGWVGQRLKLMAVFLPELAEGLDGLR